jgi:hypothetical protein
MEELQARGEASEEVLPGASRSFDTYNRIVFACALSPLLNYCELPSSQPGPLAPQKKYLLRSFLDGCMTTVALPMLLRAWLL